MKIEKIRKINKRKMIIGGLIGLGVVGAITILPSYSKYRTTQSFNLVNGKITYKAVDMNVIAMYKSEDGKSYSEHTGRMPSSGYIINEKESYCNLNGSKDNNVRLYTENGKHIIENLIKGNKCYLYFDKAITKDDIIAESTPTEKKSPFTQTSAQDGSLGLYSTADPTYGGKTYYYRGAVTNNHVVFAEKCWRIIRINGDGSIRLILDSNSKTCQPNGSGQNATNMAYNSARNDNAYVGYMKGLDNKGNSGSYAAAHTNIYDSDIKTYLDGWYDENIDKYKTGTKWSDYIDEEAGFCNDRELASGYESKGYGTEKTFYAAYDRIAASPANAQATMGCSRRSEDLFTPSTSEKGNKILGTGTSRPIGLITADEVVFAGALWGTSYGNFSYYLYNGTDYWTMSPYDASGATVFSVYNIGRLGTNSVTGTYGVRPVINLKSTTTFNVRDGEEKGSKDNPYVVQ